MTREESIFLSDKISEIQGYIHNASVSINLKKVVDMLAGLRTHLSHEEEPEDPKRKVVQISNDGAAIVALLDDGTIHMWISTAGWGEIPTEYLTNPKPYGG